MNMQNTAGAVTCTSAAVAKRIEQVRFRTMLISLFAKIVVTVIVIFLVASFIFGFAIQKGEGMYPRVRDGDLMVYFRLSETYEVGEVITLKMDGVRYTGRIVAKSGDIVNTSDEGKLIVNGAIQHEEIYYDTYTQGAKIKFPYTVPQDSYFILGDMRTGANDSRDIGGVKSDDVDGKLITILRRRGI